MSEVQGTLEFSVELHKFHNVDLFQRGWVTWEKACAPHFHTGGSHILEAPTWDGLNLRRPTVRNLSFSSVQNQRVDVWEEPQLINYWPECDISVLVNSKRLDFDIISLFAAKVGSSCCIAIESHQRSFREEKIYWLFYSEWFSICLHKSQHKNTVFFSQSLLNIVATVPVITTSLQSMFSLCEFTV